MRSLSINLSASHQGEIVVRGHLGGVIVENLNEEYGDFSVFFCSFFVYLIMFLLFDGVCVHSVQAAHKTIIVAKGNEIVSFECSVAPPRRAQVTDEAIVLAPSAVLKARLHGINMVRDIFDFLFWFC